MFMNETQINIDPVISALEDELKRLGKRKADLCSYLGISTQTYNNWRTRGLPSSRATDVANYFGWPVQKILSKNTSGLGSENLINEEHQFYGVSNFDEQTKKVVKFILNNHLKDIFQRMPIDEQVETVLDLYELFDDAAVQESAYTIKKATVLKMLNLA